MSGGDIAWAVFWVIVLICIFGGWARQIEINAHHNLRRKNNLLSRTKSWERMKQVNKEREI